jgi:hypothetical protein
MKLIGLLLVVGAALGVAGCAHPVDLEGSYDGVSGSVVVGTNGVSVGK